MAKPTENREEPSSSNTRFIPPGPSGTKANAQRLLCLLTGVIQGINRGLTGSATLLNPCETPAIPLLNSEEGPITLQDR